MARRRRTCERSASNGVVCRRTFTCMQSTTSDLTFHMLYLSHDQSLYVHVTRDTLRLLLLFSVP
jgi:hypothetical protein